MKLSHVLVFAVGLAFNAGPVFAASSNDLDNGPTRSSLHASVDALLSLRQTPSRPPRPSSSSRPRRPAPRPSSTRRPRRPRRRPGRARCVPSTRGYRFPSPGGESTGSPHPTGAEAPRGRPAMASGQVEPSSPVASFGWVPGEGETSAATRPPTTPPSSPQKNRQRAPCVGPGFAGGTLLCSGRYPPARGRCPGGCVAAR